jgi:hypothetical protein
MPKDAFFTNLFAYAKKYGTELSGARVDTKATLLVNLYCVVK